MFRKCISLSEITLPESLESIGESAFGDCSSLRAISIPEGVTSIEKSAFSNCSNLEAITIPDGVTTLSQSLFSGCVMLHEFTVPEGIVTIEDSVFGGCSGLSKITISSKVKQIGTRVFQGCSFLTLIHVDSNNKNFIAQNGILYNKEKTKLICCSPANIGRVTMLDSVTSIEDYAFYACNNISEVVLPEGVTSIGKYAFYNCSSLEKMVLPANVTSIGDWAFYGCRKLSEIIMPDNLTSIGKNAFQHCSSLTEITIPEKVTTIGMQAFGSCINLKEITIPDGVTSIEDDTFGGCSSLSKIIIPESVTTIKTYAFNLCSSLTEIIIPASVESIGKWIFNRCSEDLVVVVAQDSCAETYVKENGLLYRYMGTQDSEYSYVILPDGTLRIVGYTGSETDITIPSEIDKREVTQIGKQAFRGNTNLNTVTIHDGITSVGAGAFGNCSTTLLLMVTPDNVAETYAKENNMLYRYIGDPAPEYTYYVLSDDTLCITGYTGNETELILPFQIDGKKVTYIDDGSFSECMDITKVVIPQGVTNIGEKAFSGCRNLTEVTIPEGLTYIGAEAFYNCSSLTSITIPESVGWIDTYTFAYCTSLKEVILPDSMGTIGNYAFFACSSLTAIELPENLTKIGYMAFDSCSSLTEVILPESLYGIGIYAFSGCGKLKELEISKKVTQISKPVFDKSMTLLVWRDSYAEAYAKENKVSYRYLGETVDGYCYEVLEDNTLEITSYKGTDTELIIPFEIDGKTVTSISADAFAGCNNITSIALSKAVTYISENTFAECSEDLVLAVWQGSYAETYVKENNVSYSYTAICDHIYKGKVVVIKEATCTENGEKTITCILCGDNSMESIPAKGHNLVTDEAVEATCTSVGRTEGSHCSVCNMVLKEQEDIPVKEHSVVTDEAVEATCTSVGRTEGSRCSVCNTVLKEQQDVPVNEHICQTVVQRATTKNNGSIVVQCTVCSSIVSESVIYRPKTATLSANSYTYNGKAKKPSVSVKDTAGNKVSSDCYTVTIRKLEKQS